MKNNYLPNLQRTDTVDGSGGRVFQSIWRGDPNDPRRPVGSYIPEKGKQKLSELSIADLTGLYNLHYHKQSFDPIKSFGQNKTKICEELQKKLDNIDWDN